jgi:tRNA-splicing ligase RtcB (3'-phosphate/5'-hydroxy nucleic acid ligase)
MGHATRMTVLLERTGGVRYEIPATGDMAVPGVVFASESLLPQGESDGTLQQVANVATLPGIVGASYAMPDLHWGYGFCIGGVAATDVEAGGVVSPGGVGFDISCGVRTLVADLRVDDARERLGVLMTRLGDAIHAGAGPGGAWKVQRRNLGHLLTDGSAYAVQEGWGTAEDLEHTEDGGRLADADPDAVSDKAVDRGLNQVGSLGSGNHFLEVQAVERILDEETAASFGLREGLVVVTIHCGSRGLGHQVCTDHVKGMQKAMARYDITVPDRQLACVPVRSPEGESYFGAMAAAANYARANRQVLAEQTRRAFAETFGAVELRLLYDVSHNMAKLEEHESNGQRRLLCVHRKGATLATPGQPVIIPGSMGTASWILAGEDNEAFASTAHGAGRALSRKAARKAAPGRTIQSELEGRGIKVRAKAVGDLAEESPEAYKDVDEVVRVCEAAGLSRRVARLVPLGVVKG